MKRDFAVIIPAQESNQYHEKGDLAPFGNTTLLEWKIAQCKEFAKEEQIYISAKSNNIKKIALKENVNFIQRVDKKEYLEILRNVQFENILWTHCTSPFVNANVYIKMYDHFINKNLESIVSVNKLQEYIFFKNKKLNLDHEILSRDNIEPIYVVTNGCFIFKKNKVLEACNLILENSAMFELDNFSSLEIKDINDYILFKELIAIYFKKDVSDVQG